VSRSFIHQATISFGGRERAAKVDETHVKNCFERRLDDIASPGDVARNQSDSGT
jgi:hypothetical protein